MTDLGKLDHRSLVQLSELVTLSNVAWLPNPVGAMDVATPQSSSTSTQRGLKAAELECDVEN